MPFIVGNCNGRAGFVSERWGSTGAVAISRSPDMALKGHPLGLRFSGVSRLHIRREFYIERHGQSFQRILSSFYGTRFSLENSSSGCDAQIPFS